MTAANPLIDLRGVIKDHGGPESLRIEALTVHFGDRVVVSGLDRASAETFVHLVSGAALPDAGTVVVGGTDTRAIATDTEWLVSLDRFGIVTHRAVLLESLPVAANLALPMTLAIDPMSPDVRAHVEVLATAAGLGLDTLDGPVAALDSLARVRLHLARALATAPQVLLLERPTSELSSQAACEAFGRSLRAAADARRVGFLALSDDPDFVRESGAVHLQLNLATGALVRKRRWWPWS